MSALVWFAAFLFLCLYIHIGFRVSRAVLRATGAWPPEEPDWLDWSMAVIILTLWPAYAFLSYLGQLVYGGPRGKS